MKCQLGVLLVAGVLACDQRYRLDRLEVRGVVSQDDRCDARVMSPSVLSVSLPASTRQWSPNTLRISCRLERGPDFTSFVIDVPLATGQLRTPACFAFGEGPNAGSCVIGATADVHVHYPPHSAADIRFYVVADGEVIIRSLTPVPPRPTPWLDQSPSYHAEATFHLRGHRRWCMDC